MNHRKLASLVLVSLVLASFFCFITFPVVVHASAIPYSTNFTTSSSDGQISNQTAVYADAQGGATGTVANTSTTWSVGQLGGNETTNDILRPSANGDTVQWKNSSGSGDNYLMVDEAVSDADTTYVYTDSTGTKTDLYNVGDVVKVFETVSYIGVRANVRNTTAGVSVRLCLKTDGTIFNGSWQTVSTASAYTLKSENWVNNPKFGYGWNSTSLNALQIGIETNNTGLRCTQMYVTAYYCSYTVYRGFAYFNTSALTASAVLTSAVFNFYITSDSSETDFNIVIQNGTSAIYPHDPMVSGDYDKTLYANTGGQYSQTTGTGWQQITLTATGLGMINKVGATRLCLRSTRDTTPTTPSVVDTANAEFVSIASSESTNDPYLTVNYTLGYVPDYDISTIAHSSEWCGYSSVFSCNWTDPTGLSGYMLEHNNTGVLANSTFALFSGQTWSNITLTLNATDSQTIKYRFLANNTANSWNATEYFYFLTWSYPENIRATEMGDYIAATQNAIYYNATKPAIYFAYSNSSYDPWKFQCRAYDINAGTWTTVQTIGNSPINDPHWRPSISVLPDGRLIIFYAYGTTLKYRVSTYNASTSTNLTELISNWDTEAAMEAPEGADYNYPDPFRFDDRLLITLRNGEADIGNFSYLKYPVSNLTANLWATTNTSRKTEWTVFGSSPYLDSLRTSGIYLYNQHTYKEQGDFSFQNLNDTLATIQGVTLSVYSESVTNSTFEGTPVQQMLYIYNGTWVNVGNFSTGTFGWMNVTITTTLPVTSLINNATFYIKGKNQNVPDVFCEINVTQCKLTVNYTGFGPMTELVYFNVAGNATQSLYAYGAKYGDKLLFSYSYYDSGTIGELKNNYFFYTDDKGDTWKRVNGSTLTLPVQGDSLLAVASPHFTRNFPVLDENNKPLIVVKFQSAGWSEVYYDWQVRLAVYNSTLGSNGVWSLQNATDQNGADIYGLVTTAPAWIDAVYDRPTFWSSGAQSNYYISKYVRFPNSTTQFKAVLTDTSNGQAEETGANLVYDSTMGVYEVLSSLHKVMLGLVTAGDTQVEQGFERAYGTKFICTNTTTISHARIWLNTTIAAMEYQIAIYDSSFNRLGTSAEQQFYGSTIATWGWSASFSSPISVTSGQTYWVFFKTSTANVPYYSYDQSTVVNQSCSVALTWATAFPASLTPTTFYNQSISINCYHSYVTMRGLNFYTAVFSNTGSNSTTKGEVCLFRTYVTDYSGLSFANFRTNNTGQWVNTTYSALAGTSAWCNFTATLNNTAALSIVVAWEIRANDTGNNWASTGTQYITLVTILTFGGVIPFAFGGGGFSRFYMMLIKTAPLAFSIDKTKSIDFSRPSTMTLTFVEAFSRAVGTAWRGTASFAVSLDQFKTYAIGKESSVPVSFGFDRQRAVSWAIQATAPLGFLVFGTYWKFEMLLNLFGNVLLNFALAMQKTVGFSKQGAVPLDFVVAGNSNIFQPFWLRFFGAIDLLFSVVNDGGHASLPFSSLTLSPSSMAWGAAFIIVGLLLGLMLMSKRKDEDG